MKESTIDYVPMKSLGGLRHPDHTSSNMGWRNRSFRGFADYMQSQEFTEGLEELVELARKAQVVIMCAEVLPWRCHRWLISDALTIRGVQVEHIMTIKKRTTHTLTRWAHVEDTQITYPENIA